MFDTKRRRVIHMEERDVMTVLKGINAFRTIYQTRIGNCGWADEPDTWFIIFHATDKQWLSMLKALKTKGKFEFKYRPGIEDLYFKANT